MVRWIGQLRLELPPKRLHVYLTPSEYDSEQGPIRLETHAPTVLQYDKTDMLQDPYYPAG